MHVRDLAVHVTGHVVMWHDLQSNVARKRNWERQFLALLSLRLHCERFEMAGPHSTATVNVGALSNAIAVAIQQATVSRDPGTTSVTVTANNGSSSQQYIGGPFGPQARLPATRGPSVEERGSG